MAGAPTDRIPLHTVILPVIGVAAWLAIGKTGLEPLALVLGAALLGNVISAVHHAEVVAIRVGEPFGALILALAVTTIEVGMIISIMLAMLALALMWRASSGPQSGELGDTRG